MSTVIDVNGGEGNDLPNIVNGGEDYDSSGYTDVSLGGGAGYGTTTPSPALYSSYTLLGAFEVAGNESNNQQSMLVLVFDGTVPVDAFDDVIVQLGSNTPSTFALDDSAYYIAPGQSLVVPVGGTVPQTWTISTTENDVTCFAWPTGFTPTGEEFFANEEVTTLTFEGAPPPSVPPLANYGDVTDPNSWADPDGTSPPVEYQNVPSTVNYPLNGDGRYWIQGWSGTEGVIYFVGAPYFGGAGDVSIGWQITSTPDDGSLAQISYVDETGGATGVNIGSTPGGALQAMSGAIQMRLGTPAQVLPALGADLNKVGFSTGDASDPGTPAPFGELPNNGSQQIGTILSSMLYSNAATPLGQATYHIAIENDNGAPDQSSFAYLTVNTDKSQYILLSTNAAFTQVGNVSVWEWALDWNAAPLYFDWTVDQLYPLTFMTNQPSITWEFSGGTGSGVNPGAIAISITRNVNESVPWDSPNPFNPISYNCECMDDVVPTSTLGALQTRILNRLGFANQAANPQPGMAAFVQDLIVSAQTFLYRRYSQLHTRRMFRWKINPGQRFYSLKDNDEDVLCNFTMDPNKTIEWAGIQDSRNVWYPLIEGIPPQLYTMITKPWRPARYEIRQCIEVYPAPDQTYWLWMKAHFGLMSFTDLNDSTTIDSELIFLWALANGKAHYGAPDANNIASQANAYRKELIAGTHQTGHYIPGTIAVPPAVRPTLIQFQNNQSG